ncbi:protein-disulfide reductase DsbD family protein [Bacteroidota bacterium]
MKTIIAFIFFLFLVNIFFSQSIQAPHVEAELVSEVNTIKPGHSFWVALRLQHEPEWHTYWRNAGDAGMATKIRWELPEGFKASEIYWPYPQKIELAEVANFGFEGEVLLLTEIKIPTVLINKDSITISARCDWLVCKVECLPGSADLELTLSVNENDVNINDGWIRSFSDAREKLPIKQHEWDFHTVKSDSSIIIEAVFPEWFNYELGSIRFFPYEGGIFNNASDQIFIKDERGFSLEIFLEELRVKNPSKLSGILVSENGWRGNQSEKSIEIDIELNSTPAISSETTGINNIWMALLFAFIGGIILNLMPCVLPVLSIKILSFVQLSGNSKKKIIEHGMLFTIGVVFSFLILAALLLILRAGGEQIGWGFQLQSPIFILILSIFLFLFGLSLLGVFEIGTSISRFGNVFESEKGKFSPVLSGVSATILATPCTAPFMGSALGFALTQPTISTLLIFIFLGFGMSFPYLLFSIFPNWLKILPKPGAWMETLKQVMGFLLIATIIWLAWVLGIQAGEEEIVGLLIALLLSSLGAWIYGKWGGIAIGGRVRLIAVMVSALFILGGAFLGHSVIDGSTKSFEQFGKNSSSALNWEKFSPERFEDLKRSGKPFFVDFTAAWCLSCQVNEKVALNRTEVIEKFNKLGVIPLKADWTSRDPNITKALAEFGRNSVPLYVLYNGKSRDPEILPEILTPGIVINALENI